jgi:hypothetical protein
MPTKTTGAAQCGGACWELWSNGYLAGSVTFPAAATYAFDVSAFARLALGVGADMQLLVDHQVVGHATVSATTAQDYHFTAAVGAGAHNVAVAFTNDYYDPSKGQDRNLYVRSIAVAPTACPDAGSAPPPSSSPPPPPPPPPPTSSSPPPPPPPPPSSSSLAAVEAQNIPVGSTVFPAGVPTSYSWYRGKNGTIGLTPAPSGFTAITGWGQIYPQAGATNTPCHVLIQGFATYLHRNSGGWELVQSEATNSIGGAHYVADFANNASYPWNETQLADGSVSVDSPNAGYNDHYWPGTRGTFAANTVNGVFVRVMLKTDNANANLVANVGADWWLSATAGYTVVNGVMVNNPGAGMSDWVKLSTDYQPLYFTTLTAAELEADPPPLP